MSTKKPHKGRERDKALHPAPGKGAVKIGEQSGLRKLMRAARRGKIPEERMLTIRLTQENTAMRADRWENPQDRFFA